MTEVYGPSSCRGREAFWQEIINFNGLCCVGGDLNVVRRIAEKFNGGRATKSTLAARVDKFLLS